MLAGLIIAVQDFEAEFSHTVLHGPNVQKGLAGGSAQPRQRPIGNLPSSWNINLTAVIFAVIRNSLLINVEFHQLLVEI